MSNTERCVLLPTNDALEGAIKSNPTLFVLFYASWCPFSREFLPVFQDHADRSGSGPCYTRILVDDKDDVIKKYSIEVFPTVLFFENGRIARRLDGTFHVGLDEDQLKDFVWRCGVKK